MSRPSFESIFMHLAMALAKRSTCGRLKVGTVITSADFRYVYGMGYNGNATGLKNGCDSDEPGKCGCLHSEMNAIINCNTPRDVPKIVFITHLPCVACAKSLINLGGVKHVFFMEDYRIKTALELLESVGIKTTRMIEVPPGSMSAQESQSS